MHPPVKGVPSSLYSQGFLTVVEPVLEVENVSAIEALTAAEIDILLILGKPASNDAVSEVS